MIINFHGLDEQKVRAYAIQTEAQIMPNGLKWDGPPEAPQNSLIIPYSDLGVGNNGMVYRMSIYPQRENVLKIKR